mgnify:CR=1 FL=1
MAQSTKRAVRAAAGRFNQLTNDELRERVKEPLTESEFAALERVFAQRGMKMPAEHGEVSEDPTPGTRVISLEELNDQDFGLDKRKTGMGWPEVVAVIVGIPRRLFQALVSHLGSAGPCDRDDRLRHPHLCPQVLARDGL